MSNKIMVSYPLNLTLLQTAIQTFITQFITECKQDLQKMLKHNNPIKLKSYDDQFIIDCIRICLSIELKDYFQDVNKFCTQKMRQNVRKYYFQMFTSDTWKNQFQFQQFMVLFTKLIGRFFGQTFVDLKIDQDFQSEIYLILIYTLLGTKVSIKVFPILEKKYLKPKPNQQLADNQKKQKKIDKTLPKSIKQLKKSRSKQRFTYYQPPELESSIGNRLSKWLSEDLKTTNIQQFMKGLRDNLYAIPLQKAISQKKTLQSNQKFPKQKKQRKQTDDQTKRKDEKNTRDLMPIPKFTNANPNPNSNPQTNTNNYSEYSFHSSNKNKQIIRNNTFSFGQLSSSLHFQIEKRNLSNSINQKSVKPKRRKNFNSKGFIIFNNATKQLQTQAKIKYQSELQSYQKQKLSSQEWNSVINKIREQFSSIKEKNDKNRTTLRNFQFQNTIKRHLLEKQVMAVQKDNQGQNKLVKKQFKWRESNQLQNHDEAEQNKITKIQCDVKDLRQIKQIQRPVKKRFNSHQNLILNKSELKQMKKQFDLDAVKRHHKINYTMFLLPSVKNKENLPKFIR